MSRGPHEVRQSVLCRLIHIAQLCASGWQLKTDADVCAAQDIAAEMRLAADAIEQAVSRVNEARRRSPEFGGVA
jgi:hypothetical protein